MLAKKIYTRRFLKYSAVGFSGTLIDFVVLIFLVEVFAWPVLIANTISFLLAVINNYSWNKLWTYKDKNKRVVHQFTKFLCVSVVGFAINSLLMLIFLKVGIWYVAAKVFIVAIVLIWNFIMNTLWTFRKTDNV
jgi:putative flippase GtrA